jgi:hypothetical protein
MWVKVNSDWKNIFQKMKEKEKRKDELITQNGIVMDNLVKAWNENESFEKRLSRGISH